MSPADREVLIRVLLEEGAIRPEIFSAIVEDYVDYWKSGDRAIAAAHGVPVPTVRAWVRGEDLPSTDVRQAVVDWIWEQLE